MENEVYRKENYTGVNLNGVQQPNNVNSQKPETYSPQSLLSSREILNESWSLYKARFKTLLGVALIPPLIFILLLILFILLNSLLLGLGFIFIFIVAIYVFTWGRAALIYAIKDSVENIGIKESFKRGKGKIYQVFLVSFLSGLITAGGFLLFGIPGIIFSIWFSFAIFIVVEEDLVGMNVLLKSREYVRGYWWSVVWRNLYFSGILMVIGFVFSFFEGLFSLLNLQSLGELINLINIIISVILTPLATIYQFLIYKNLKEIKGDSVSIYSGKSKIAYILISILGVLFYLILIYWGIAMFMGLSSAKDRASDAMRKSEMISVYIDLEKYASDNDGTYPTSLEQLVPKYTNEVPIDAKTKLPYEYNQTKNGKGFQALRKA